MDAVKRPHNLNVDGSGHEIAFGAVLGLLPARGVYHN